MRPALVLAVPFVLLLGAIVFACGGGSGGKSGFGGSSSGSGSSGGSSGGSGSSGSGSGCGLLCGNGDGGMGPGPCQGLQCAAADCTSMGKPETSLTGHVYDPAGNLPLYNVYVYVPNTTPQPIAAGNPECNACEAPASGGPIIGQSTKPDGSFTIQKGPNDDWGVPAGNNGGKGIPLVVQVGKWRKQLVIPTVNACAPNDLDMVFNTGTGTAKQMRLPAKGSEGDMPLVAFTSGCDPAECFLRHVGIDDSEFAPPGTAGKHVHFYTANAGSAVAGGNTVQSTYAWWTDSAKLLQYDIIFNACECTPFGRGAGAYGAMDVYLKKGGRLFTTHYYGNWFIPTTGTADLQSVAKWNSNDSSLLGWSSGPANGSSENDLVDQTFPKGVAYAQWLQDNGISTSLGAVTLADLRDDISAPAPAGCSQSAGSCLSTRWIYNPADQHPRYLSFNTPVGTPVAQQCGRAVYSDVHLSGSSDTMQFPTECNDPNIDQPPGHAINEKALEFLFFDLSSCVQNDSTNPPPPPPAQ